MTQEKSRTTESIDELADNQPLSLPDLNIPEGVTSIGHTIYIKGEVTAAEHLIIEGTLEGQIFAPEHSVAVGHHANVSADITAKAVTVLGRVKGQLTASDLVEIREHAAVIGRIYANKVSIVEGARFNGHIDPRRTETSFAVNKHRLKKRKDSRTVSAPVY